MTNLGILKRDFPIGTKVCKQVGNLVLIEGVITGYTPDDAVPFAIVPYQGYNSQMSHNSLCESKCTLFLPITITKYSDLNDRMILEFSSRNEIIEYITENQEEDERLKIESDECGENLIKFKQQFTFEDVYYDIYIDC